MLLLRRFAACLALSAAAACAGRAGPESGPGAGRGALADLLDLPLERRGAAIEAFVRAARPRLLVEVVPREPFEAEYGGLLPIGLEDFDILRIVVEQSEAGVVLDPGVALVPVMPEGRAGAEPLPMYAPTRELFLAFTGEQLAGPHTRYRLKTAGLPWLVNLLTVGVLELATLELEGEAVQPTEEEHARAAPRATQLAALVSPLHGCAHGRSPCDRYLIVPRQRDDVPLRLDLDLELGDAVSAVLRVSWSASLPAGKPLAARLDDVFHGAARVLDDARVEPANMGEATATSCRLRNLWCVSPATAGAARPASPPAIVAPKRLATPAESLAARPRWYTGEGYAPGTGVEAVAPGELVASGPLRDALLICDLEVEGGSNASTLVIEARAGALPVHHPKVYAHEKHPRFIVPLVQLDPGEALAVSVWRRSSSWIWGTHDLLLGRASLVHGGALPLTYDADGMTVSCAALGRDGLERQVATRMEALGRKLATFDVGVDPIALRQSDWGLGSWGMRDLQDRVERIAGLVGWSDPRIRALLPALDHYRDVFYRHLGRLLAARREQLPAPGALLSFRDGDLRVIGSACGEAIDRKRILWAREKVPKDGCVTIVEILGRGPTRLEFSPRTGSLGSVWSPELAWEDGRRTDAWAVGIEPPAGVRRRDPEHPRLAAGESVRVYLAPQEPFHREGEGEVGPLFLLALDGLEPVFIRLR